MARSFYRSDLVEDKLTCPKARSRTPSKVRELKQLLD
jgi:hypothetical protein